MADVKRMSEADLDELLHGGRDPLADGRLEAEVWRARVSESALIAELSLVTERRAAHRVDVGHLASELGDQTSPDEDIPNVAIARLRALRKEVDVTRDECRRLQDLSMQPRPTTQEPVPMLLTCPACGHRHIDRGPFATKPHHTHACQHCGTCWRPAVVHTVGVQFLPGFKDED